MMTKRNFDLYQAKRRVDPVDEPGRKGLKNLGNTCFMNAGLQCLSHIKPLADYFLSGRYKGEINAHNKLGYKGQLAETFAELQKVLWQSKGPANASEIKQRLKEIFPQMFENFQQQDVQEFLGLCLDGLHEDLSRVSEQGKFAADSKSKSFLADLIEGQLLCELHCLHCGHRSRNLEPFTSLSLPVKQGMCTVSDAMREYTKDRTLTTDLHQEQHSPVHPEGFIHLRPGEVNNCFTELRGLWEQQTAEEDRRLHIMTWYADPQRWPRCQDAHEVQLSVDMTQWMIQILEAWDDRADPDEVFHLYMVKPHPQAGYWDDSPTPHVLIVQHPAPDRRCLHLTVSDDASPSSRPRQFVATFAHPATQSSVLQEILQADQNSVSSDVQCDVWWGDDLVSQDVFERLSHGNALTVFVRQQEDAGQAHSSTSDGTSEHISLLQKQTTVKPVQLTLDELIPNETAEPQPTDLEQVAVRLVPGTDMAPLPTYVECQLHWCEEDLVEELHHWGHSCDVYRFGEHDVALCFPCEWSFEDDLHHYMFCHSDVLDQDGRFLHSQQKAMTELDLMRLLYDYGYWRATIQSVEILKPGFSRVKFLNVQVQQAPHPSRCRTKPTWHTCSHLVGARGPFFTPVADVAEDDCVIGFGIPLHNLMRLFESTDGMLCRDPTGYNFPEVTQAALQISASTCLDDYDRIIVYTDGSSKAKDRHRPPAWNDESGHGDSWAFVVIGETITKAEHKIEVLGWSTQPVIYDQCSDHFIGADGVGSYLAEREALAWAARAFSPELSSGHVISQ